MFQCEVRIEKPVREVYRAFNDPDDLPRWITGLQRTEPISGKPGEVGSRTRQVYLERGRTVELIETITAHEPEKHFAGTIEAPGVNMALEVDFVDEGDATLVRMRSDPKSKGFAMSLMMPFLKGTIRKRQEGDLKRFKQMVESGDL